MAILGDEVLFDADIFVPTRRPVRNVAVVGCGYWGINHLRVLSQMEGIEVTPVDMRPGVAADHASRFRLNRSARELDEVVGDMDAVVIATPPSTHHELGIRALEAGCHILVEKPLSVDPLESLEMIHAAARADRTLAVGHTFLFSPPIERLAATVNSAEFGQPVHVHSDRLNLGLYRDDVSVIWDLAPHDVSILNFVLGAKPVAVQCWASQRRSANSDVATLALTYAQPDVMATIRVSWLHPEKVRRLTVVGENLMAQLDDTSATEPLRIYDIAIVPGDDPTKVSYKRGGITIPLIESAEPLQRELADFISCCETGRKPRSDGWTGHAVTKVLHAADESIRQGVQVEVGWDPTPAKVIDLRAAASQRTLLDFSHEPTAGLGTGSVGRTVAR